MKFPISIIIFLFLVSPLSATRLDPQLHLNCAFNLGSALKIEDLSKEYWPLPPHNMRVAIDGAEHTETVVLIHGMTADGRTFGDVAKSLGRYFRVVRIDLRGHGETPAYGWNYGSEVLANDIASVMKHLEAQWPNPTKTFHVLGHSFGGRVALRFAELFPQRVKSVVIEDMGFLSYRNLEECDPAKRKSVWKAGQLFLSKNPGIGFMNGFLSAGNIEAWKALSDKEFVVHLFSSFVSCESYDNALHSLKVPMLVLYPQNARVRALSNEGISQLQRLVKHLRLRGIADATHDIHNSQADRYLKEVGGFFDEVVRNVFVADPR